MENDEKSLSLVMNKVAGDGYVDEFRLSEGKMTLGKDTKQYYPEDLLITKSYRFEGETDPGDMAVLYLIHTNDGKKGILVDAYGTYSDRKLSDFLKNVPVSKDDESREA
ncbi:MAG: hypothetical protein KDC42_09745 [Ignavibacteriae bacterium]|nr:hypothetical protein [Ignavibacteriota bacterium]